MKYLRWLAVLVLPVVAAISLGVLASAAPGNGAPLPLSATDDAGSASRAEASTAAVLESYISNQSSIGHGVMSRLDGVYDMGRYDAILPPGWRTDTHFRWNYANGVYIGPGGCAKFLSWTGSSWWDYGNFPAGTYDLPNNWGQDIARWEIRNC